MELAEKVSKFSFMNGGVSQETKDFFKDLLLKHPRVSEVKDFVLLKNVDSKRLNDYWYSGEVAVVEYDDYSFSLSAEGEQRYALFIRDFDKFDTVYKGKLQSYNREEYKKLFDNNEPIEVYVNKSNSRDSFFDVFGCYFSSDEELTKLISEADGIFELKCENNNWLEIFCRDEETEELKCLTDIFSGVDIGSNIVEDIKYILDEKEELIKLYKSI